MTLDLILIQRHILLMAALDSPSKIIAADVNGSGMVTTLDLVLIRSLILFNQSSFPGNKLWNFVRSDFNFTDTDHPFPFDSTRALVHASATSGQDFIGVKLGDVNGSWDMNGGRVTAGGEVQFNLEDQIALPDAEIVVPVKVSGFTRVGGYQFTLNWDSSVLQFQGVDNQSLIGNYGTSHVGTGRLTTS